MPKALVIGSRGQDGSYLMELLQAKGYERIGVTRTGVEGGKSHRNSPISLNFFDLGALLAAEQPDEIYYLAAFHNSSEDEAIGELDLLHRSFETNTHGLFEVLCAVRHHSPKARLFYAASSHVFGEPSSKIQDENTPLNPVNIYGISKTAGVHLCRYFRERYNLRASVGILFNHESPRRSKRFLSRKIVQAAVNIKRGTQECLNLGRLDILVDWGYAPDYVRAMWDILQLNEPGDFVVATGVLHSVQDFVVNAFEIAGLTWSQHVLQQETVLTKQPLTLCGDSTKLRRAAKWKPETSFEELIRIMMKAEFRCAS